MLYRYTGYFAKYDENSLKAYYINPDEIDEKLRILRENLMNGDGFSGIQSEYMIPISNAVEILKERNLLWITKNALL